MGDFAVEGSELKQMVKLARRQPVPFAFNPGKGDDDTYLGMHRKKSPALIGKEGKKEGGGVKVAFGTAEIDGKCLNLTCERSLAGLAKKMKKYLKSQKVLLSVRVMDAEGNMLESELDDDAFEGQDSPEDAAADADAGAPSEAEVAADADEAPALDAQAIVAQLTADRNRMKALSPEMQGKLAGPLQAVVATLKSGDLQSAAAGADKITAAIDKMLAAQPSAQAEPAAPEADFAALAAKLKSLRDAFSGVTDQAALAGLIAELKTTAGHVRDRQADQAEAGISKIEAALAALSAPAAEPAAATATEDAAAQARQETGIEKGTVKKRSFLMTRWQQIPGELKAEIGKLRAAMIEDVPEEDPASLTASIESTLDAFCEEMQEALDDAINAGDPGYTKSVKLIGDFRQRVQSDVLIQHIKNNPFDDGADVEPVLLAAFDEMQKVLSA